MRKVILAVVMLFAVSTVPVFALNDTEQNQGQGQLQGQIQDQLQRQSQGQGQSQGQFASGGDAQQGQIQGNLGIQSGNDVATSTETVTNVDGDKVKAYAFSAPGLSANKGVGEANIYSVFGGVGIAQTEEYQVMIDQIAVIERLQAAGYITEEQAKAEAVSSYLQMRQATAPKRVLGLLWKTNGRHLLNVFGLLANDDLLSKLPKKEKTTDRNISGNEGYVVNN